MFPSKELRYMTKAIDETVHPEIASQLWYLIDQLKARDTEIDYLQVFELSKRNGNQVVCHRQEIPAYEEWWVLVLKEAEPITTRIWCIDDGKYQTMLFPDDY